MNTEQHILSMTRDFDAPRELVFKAFTDPDQLAAWFGPVGVDSPRDRIVVDPRVGGAWQLVMTWDEDGVTKESPIDAVITAYDPPALLVATQKAEPDDGVILLLEMRLEFEDLGGRTRLHITQGPFDSEEWVEMTREGWGTSFTKLDGILVQE
ncbi:MULTISPECIES: SRPBCC domain-containing protein [Arthrobacter]|uniref:SRPBCC domain-containing protein n=1 Tax=Arthrobacter terricola TaxID=2547396 RepID=A0A4R5KQF2_9MICC|nr:MULTISPECIES: SRPBCC domain-containing protein [Arthrobacter]MBT8160649.1 SRPBCC domain-containing protein [Arthrobacter sp. GN70]TDF97806.1 SRPBCC domain-containing protein [Arthrobacter terricola]